MIAIFDWLLMDVNAQINGIVAIEDMTGFNLRHSMQIYNTENSKKFMAIYQVNYMMVLNARETLSSEGCEPHMRRPAWASTQSDQRLCYSLIGKYHMLTCYKRNYNFSN